MISNLLCHLSPQADVLKLTKKAQIKVFLDVWVVFPKFLGKKNLKKNRKYVKFSCVCNCFYFVLEATFAGKSVQSYNE